MPQLTPTSSSGRPEKPAAKPWSILVAVVRGIPIRVHFTFLLLLVWIASSAIGSGAGSPLNRVLYVLAIFFCVVLHELGHSVVAQAFGIGVSDIVLYPIGGVARLEKQPKPKQELWIALAGPAVNVLIALLLWGVLSSTGGLDAWDRLRMGDRNLVQQLMAANVLLALFNLIPAFPMDGGRVLRALLSLAMGESAGTRIATVIGQLAAFALALFGLMNGQVMLLFIAFLVFVSAGQEATQQQQKDLATGVPASDAMLTDIHTLPSGATLKQAADLLLDTSQQDFPIMLGEAVVGILTRQGLVRGLAGSGPNAYVTEAMDREFCSFPANVDLTSALEKMQTSGSTCSVVLRDNLLVGMLTTENISEYFVLKQLMSRAT